MFYPTLHGSMTCIEFSASCLNIFVTIREPAAGSAVVVSQLFLATTVGSTAVAILGDLPSTEPRPWTQDLHHHRQYLGL